MNLLIVEDDKRVRQFLEDALRAEGWTVQVCGQYSELKDRVDDAMEGVDVAILDRMLGSEDSLRLLKPLRQANPGLKILVLSAIGGSDEKALALDAGADDYMTKPYSLVELTARIRALGRREGDGRGGTRYVLADLKLDLVAHTAEAGGRRLDLSNKEFKLLSCLMRRPGQVYSKFQLLDRVWDTQLDLETNVVEVTVRNLRRKLEEAEAKARISSRRNVGYWIEE